MWSQLEKWETGFLFPKRSWEDWETEGCKIFLSIFFLRRQNDVVSKESQTLFCPEAEMFEFFFHERKRELTSARVDDRF